MTALLHSAQIQTRTRAYVSSMYVCVGWCAIREIAEFDHLIPKIDYMKN